MQKTGRTDWTLLLAAVMIAACAPSTEIVKLYDNQAVIQHRYEHLLVIAISNDFDQRHALEDQIVARLRGDGTHALPSYTVLGGSESILQDDINEAAAIVRQLHIDELI